jgi:PrtD family type I secretion system ABC transporter
LEPIAPAAGAAPALDDKLLAHVPDKLRASLTALGERAKAGATTDTTERKQRRLPNVEETARGGELERAIRKSRSALKAVGLFSAVINILMLTGPLFMLQVYDRVMTSGSMPTLVALSLLTASLYAVIGLLELVRSRVIVRLGVEIDQRIGDRIFEASLVKTISGQGNSVSALRELDTLRSFVAGPGPLTFFDAWWTPAYLLVVFLMHWSLGIAATIGAIVLLIIAWASEAQSRAPLAEAGKATARSVELAETGQRNAEAIAAMGMLSAYRARWQATNQEALAWQVVAADRLGGLGAVSKAVRLLLQSLMLAIGAALAINGLITAGSIVAATIIFGRALAPVEQGVSHWRSFVKALESYRKLEALLKTAPAREQKTTLPTPRGHLSISNLRVAAPETRQLILANLNFEVVPGQMLAVIGPSASGKSTLARTLVGLWQPFSGTIKLDGARLDQWDPEDLGQHIGYLPQDVELFAGTVRDNISRFRTDATDAAVMAAATAAHAHDLITALPKGYDTQLGAFGTHLSAGQRQRVALARALYDNPPLIVLDEPNANLDRAGDEALAAAIDGMRMRGQAIVLISHRVQAIGMADTLLYLERGVQRAFGPRADVMRAIQGAGEARAKPAPSHDDKALPA